jgi:hypothetical protein
MSEAFEKWIKEYGKVHYYHPAGSTVWDASRAATLAEVERAINDREKLLSKGSEFDRYAAGEYCVILSAIRAMKEGGV